MDPETLAADRHRAAGSSDSRLRLVAPEAWRSLAAERSGLAGEDLIGIDDGVDRACRGFSFTGIPACARGGRARPRRPLQVPGLRDPLRQWIRLPQRRYAVARRTGGAAEAVPCRRRPAADQRQGRQHVWAATPPSSRAAIGCEGRDPLPLRHVRVQYGISRRRVRARVRANRSVVSGAGAGELASVISGRRPAGL